MSGKTHPNEAHLLGFIKSIQTREYCKIFADWVNLEYPGSGDVLLPALRERWQRLE